jgi:hypothetical protein
MKSDWFISIDDGYSEYTYKVRIDDRESISLVYGKICKLFNSKCFDGHLRKPVNTMGLLRLLIDCNGTGIWGYDKNGQINCEFCHGTGEINKKKIMVYVF